MQHVKVVFEFEIPDDECPYEAAERLVREWCTSSEALSEYADVEIEDAPS